MSGNKTMLRMIVEESYHLVAIHCSREAYQIAFFLNQNLHLKLKREQHDIDFKHTQLTAFYPLFHYFDRTNCCDYYLVANKFEGGSEIAPSSKGLFEERPILTTYLLQEYKNVEFFLKIEEETQTFQLDKIIRDLNKIPQIFTAYEVDVETLKSKENLIFN